MEGRAAGSKQKRNCDRKLRAASRGLASIFRKARGDYPRRNIVQIVDGKIPERKLEKKQYVEPKFEKRQEKQIARSDTRHTADVRLGKSQIALFLLMFSLLSTLASPTIFLYESGEPHEQKHVDFGRQ